MVLNSLESVEKLMYEFRPGFIKSFKLGTTNIFEKVSALRRLRTFSTTFNRFDDDEYAAHDDIVVTRAGHPYDMI